MTLISTANVVQAEQGDRVGAELGVEAEALQQQDAVVLLAEAEFARGGDHAVGGVPVGLARGDRERAGQHGAREGRHHDLVADREVVGAADDAAGLRLADIHLAPVDGLAVGLRLRLERQHLADHDGAFEAVRGAVDVFFFEADLHERGVDVFRGGVGGHIRELTKPAQWNAHQTTIPNCWLKRISPSTMSRMSSRSLRNISVRSMPMPKAKP